MFHKGNYPLTSSKPLGILFLRGHGNEAQAEHTKGIAVHS